MKIVCPTCNARYDVPEVVLTSRRKMRCARCGGEWVPGDTDAPEPPPPLADAVAAPPADGPVIDVPAGEPKGAAPADDEPAATPELTPAFAAPPDADRPHPADEEALATMADPAPTWPEAEAEAEAGAAHAEPVHDFEREPVVPTEPMVPPRPVALRPETAVSLHGRLPDPATIVVPPAAKGPPVMEWVASVTLVVAFCAALVVFRGPVMKVWPPSARLYSAMGLGPK